MLWGFFSAAAENPCGSQAVRKDIFASIYFMSDSWKISNCIIKKKKKVASIPQQESVLLKALSIHFALIVYVHSSLVTSLKMKK